MAMGITGGGGRELKKKETILFQVYSEKKNRKTMQIDGRMTPHVRQHRPKMTNSYSKYRVPSPAECTRAIELTCVEDKQENSQPNVPPVAKALLRL